MQKFTAFSNYLRQKDRSENTVKNYVKDLSGFANWFKYSNGEELRPENITPMDAREYRQWLLATQGRSPSTFNRHLAAIRSYVNWAVQAGIAPANPLLEIRSVKTNLQAKARWLSQSATIGHFAESRRICSKHTNRNSKGACHPNANDDYFDAQ